MFYRVDMYADDEDHAVISMSERQARSVRNFLSQVKEEMKGVPSWVGGIWDLVGPFETEEIAWKHLRDGKRREIAPAGGMPHP